jgi:putative hemolysin
MSFNQKISLDFQCDHYRVRTISSVEDLAQVLALRQECFPLLKQSDLEFDLNADHIVVEDINTQTLCGAYRISSSTFTADFQTREDFQMEEFLRTPDVKAELAWACIHPDYRNGSAIALLWRGITSYLKQIDAKYVFGTTSVNEISSDRLSRIQEVLRENNCVYKAFPVKPVSPKTDESVRVLGAVSSKNERKSLRVLPALLRAYIFAGAFVCASPNFDFELNCYDFMTIIDMDNSADQIASHFGG